MASAGQNVYDIPDAGMGGQFSALRVGGDLYLATIAKGGRQGRLFVGKPSQMAPIDLDQLGITGALQVALDRGPNGTLVAYVSRIIDTDGEDKGRRVITPIDTGIAVGAAPEPSPTPAPVPVEPPAPPGATGDLTSVMQTLTNLGGALQAVRAQLDADIASAHSGVDAVFDRIGIDKASEPTVAERLAALETAFGAVPDFRTKAWETDGLPDALVANLGSQWQRDLAFTAITLLEHLLRLPEFPRADGGTILKV